jgi:hypothetical protein
MKENDRDSRVGVAVFDDKLSGTSTTIFGESGRMNINSGKFGKINKPLGDVITEVNDDEKIYWRKIVFELRRDFLVDKKDWWWWVLALSPCVNGSGGKNLLASDGTGRRSENATTNETSIDKTFGTRLTIVGSGSEQKTECHFRIYRKV